jgi:riboflavin kinase/FMN adenylyltransferase
MLHIRDTKQIKLDENIRTAVALGKFDGIHRGHMELINQVLRLQDKGLTGVLFTFDMKKNRVFDVNGIKNIYTQEEKKQVVADTGTQIMVEYPFDDEFADMSAESFIKDVLVDMLRVSHIVVGEDFRFGKDRKGDVALLMENQERYDYTVTAVKKLKADDHIISSSAIRECIATGDVELAETMLGRTYHVSGKVVYGKQLGRRVGIPTANLEPSDRKLYPKSGVYATRIRILSEDRRGRDILYKGITNVGANPTVSNKGNITVETHIFDFSEDIYEKEIQVYFVKYLRREHKFSGLDELVCQMNRDIQQAKMLL